MSKLDELDLEMKMHRERIFWKQDPKIKGLDVREMYDADEADKLARKYYELGKLEEREAMREKIKGMKKEIGEPKNDLAANPSEWNITRTGYNTALFDILTLLDEGR